MLRLTISFLLIGFCTCIFGWLAFHSTWRYAFQRKTYFLLLLFGLFQSIHKHYKCDKCAKNTLERDGTIWNMDANDSMGMWVCLSICTVCSHFHRWAIYRQTVNMLQGGKKTPSHTPAIASTFWKGMLISQ